MSYWLTTLSQIQRREADWTAIAPYEAPLRRFLARRATLPTEELEDLVQDLLLAMKERLVERYDAEQGSFRSFLATVAHNRLLDHLRARRRDPRAELPPVPAPPAPDELAATQLEAEVLRALTALRQRFLYGARQNRELLYVFSGVLVDGLGLRAIAEREGLSLDQVKRRLGEMRQALLEELLGGDRASADLTRACLRKPSKRPQILAEASPARRERVEAFLETLSAARRTFGGGAGDSEFVRGLGRLLDPEEE